jgi:hypothetical protein
VIISNNSLVIAVKPKAKKKSSTEDVLLLYVELIRTTLTKSGSVIRRLIVWNAEKLSELWKKSTAMAILRMTKLTVEIVQEHHYQHLHTKFYQTFFSQAQFHTFKKLLGTVSVDFDVIGQQLNTEKKAKEFNGTVKVKWSRYAPQRRFWVTGGIAPTLFS